MPLQVDPRNIDALGSTLLVIDIAPQDAYTLAQIGVSPLGDPSWLPGCRRDEALIELLAASAWQRSLPTNVEARTVSVGANAKTPAEYFGALGAAISSTIDSRDPSELQIGAIALNLMPYGISATRIDRLVETFLTQSQAISIPNVPLILLMRNIDLILKSECLANARKGGALWSPLLVLDYRGHSVRFDGESEEQRHVKDRTPFRNVLDTNSEAVYRSLVFGTNAYLGHFSVKKAHIRTHYDLQDFIRKDASWEYVYAHITQLIGDSDRVLGLAVGLEHGALYRIGDQLKASLEERNPVDFRFIESTSATRSATQTWTDEADVAVVITDIVNTGKTVKPVVRALTASNAKRNPIHVFAIAGMRNSPKMIEGIPVTYATQIRRDFYHASHCSLCDLGQPLRPISKVEDFRYVAKEQLTPYDFWEIVQDSKALRRSSAEAPHHSFPFRIDTTKVIQRYQSWLCNVVREKFEAHWGDTRPDILCTVGSEPGSEFAKLVSQAIGVRKILEIPRSVLNKITPGSAPPADIVDKMRDVRQVLIVDDGVNRGATLMSLTMVCRTAGSTPTGALVLTNRLSPKETSLIRKRLGAPIVTLYDWACSSND